MGASGRQGTSEHNRNSRFADNRPGYDFTDAAQKGTAFDWASANMDVLAAATQAVLVAGDMVSFTMDRGGYAVLVTICTASEPIKKWCNDVHVFNDYLLKVYDRAIARQNTKTPPTLPGMP